MRVVVVVVGHRPIIRDVRHPRQSQVNQRASALKLQQRCAACARVGWSLSHPLLESIPMSLHRLALATATVFACAVSVPAWAQKVGATATAGEPIAPPQKPSMPGMTAPAAAAATPTTLTPSMPALPSVTAQAAPAKPNATPAAPAAPADKAPVGIRPPTDKPMASTTDKPAAASGGAEVGLAAVYNDKLQGRKTANGQRYDRNLLTAAHKTLPFGTMVRVTNVKNKKSVVLRINDRGPFQQGRILDISPRAAKALGIHRLGMAEVSSVVVGKKK
jgi:rare lipoprotein A